MEEQEICLRDYIVVILKRKWIIIVTFLVCLVSSVIMVTINSFTKVKESGFYKSRATIQMGAFEGDVIGKNDFREIIKGSSIVNSAVNKTGISPDSIGWYRVNSVDVKETTLIGVEVEAEKSDTAGKLCKEISEESVSYGNELYNKRKAAIIERLEITEKEIEDIKKAKKDAEDMLVMPDELGQGAYSERRKVLEQILSDIGTELKNKDKDITDLENKLSEITKNETSVDKGQESMAKWLRDSINSNRNQKASLINNEYGMEWNRISYYGGVIRDRDNRLGDISRHKNDLDSQISRGREFKIISLQDNPEYVSTTTKGKKKVNVALAAVIGIVLGIFLAFCVEYWQKNFPKQSEKGV